MGAEPASIPAMTYKQTVHNLMGRVPFEIDQDTEIKPRKPTMANSMFLTNKEQGDWAEKVVLGAINENSDEYVAMKYGRDDSLPADDPNFDEFFTSYINELNTIGKRPDILIYKKNDISDDMDLESADTVNRAVAALEVRSSSFLAKKYARYINDRTKIAETEIVRMLEGIRKNPYGSLLKEKNPAIHELLHSASTESFRDIDFRLPSWRSTEDLKHLSGMLRSIKAQISILHKRDHLSITPKLEDLLLVNRWIQAFGVRHYYLQVFFDKAYIIPFKRILEIVSDSNNEEAIYTIEADVKNQNKTTIKVDLKVGSEILGKLICLNIAQDSKSWREGVCSTMLLSEAERGIWIQMCLWKRL